MPRIGATLGLTPLMSTPLDVYDYVSSWTVKYSTSSDSISYHCPFMQKECEVSTHGSTLRSVRGDRIREAATLAKQDADLLQLSKDRWETVQRSIALEFMYGVCEKFVRDGKEAEEDAKTSQVAFNRKRKEMHDQHKLELEKLRQQHLAPHKRARPLYDFGMKTWDPPAAGISTSAPATASEDDEEGEENEEDRAFVVTEAEERAEEQAEEEAEEEAEQEEAEEEQAEEEHYWQ
jgi:hypothetical protein